MLLRSASGKKSRWTFRGRSQSKVATADHISPDASHILKNSPYMHQNPYNPADVSASILGDMPAISRANRKSADRLSGRWDNALETMCDSHFEPSKRLSLRLDFESESKTTPLYPLLTSPDSRLQTPPSPGGYTLPPQSPKSRNSKASSGKRILRNIPTVHGGFWSMCMRSVPKIKFVKKFEESEV